MTQHARTIGIEIEYKGSANRSLRSIGDSGIEIVDERHRARTTFFSDRWVLGYDGSPGVDWEAKCPPLRDTSEIRTVMAAIRSAGGRITRGCGTHIHIGIGDFDSRQLARLSKMWLRHEKALDDLQPESRRHNRNGYCYSNYAYAHTSLSQNQPMAGADLTDAFAHIDDSITNRMSSGSSLGAAFVSTVQGGNRQVKMNLKKYETAGTVEFRGHSGTLNFNKINSWISVLAGLVAIAEGYAPITPLVASFEEMLAELTAAAPATHIDRALPSRPRAGTLTGNIWAEADRLRLNRDSRWFNPRGGLASTQRELAGHLVAAFGFNPRTMKTALSYWVKAHGLGSRATRPQTLHGYLTTRAATLAA